MTRYPGAGDSCATTASADRRAGFDQPHKAGARATNFRSWSTVRDGKVPQTVSWDSLARARRYWM